MKLSARLLLFLLATTLALSAHAKNPRWGKVSNAQIHGVESSRQPEAPGNTPVALPLTTTLETASQCTRAIVAFRNASRSTLTLTIGDAAPVKILPKQAQRFCAQDDVVGWQVNSADGWQYGGRMEVAGLRLREETLITPSATLVIVNGTGELQRLQIDGRQIGKLPPGKQKTIGPLSAGELELIRPLVRREIARGGVRRPRRHRPGAWWSGAPPAPA